VVVSPGYQVSARALIDTFRTLLIHGARAALYRARHKDDRHGCWINQVRDRRGTNRACIALANKNARIIWALMAHGDEYRRIDSAALAAYQPDSPNRNCKDSTEMMA